MIKLNNWITIDEENQTVHIKERIIKLRKCRPKKEYLEPFQDTEEPDVWIMIRKEVILVKLFDKYLCSIT